MRRVWLPVSIVAGLLLLLTYCFLQSQSPALGLRARIQEAVHTLQLHDAELTRDVLLARAGRLAHYDALPRTGQRLVQALGALRAASATVAGPAAPAIRQHVEALTEALHQKITLVTYFTSDNALLRNSVLYLTYTGQTLGTHIGADPAVTADLAAFSHAMLRFMHLPDASSGHEAEAALQRLAHHAMAQSRLHALVGHGRLIFEILPQVDRHVQQIIAAPTALHVEALQDAVLQYATRVEARAQRFRTLLYGVAVLLLGYLLSQFVRLRAHARALRRANADLQQEMRERQQAVAALRTSEERFRAITESANAAIISADSAGHIVSWNAQAEAIFGYTAAETAGMPLTRLMPDRYQASHRQRFAAWSTTGVSRLVDTTVEFTGRRKDGSEFPVEVSLSTWSAAHEHYVTGMLRDLTAHKQLQDTTRQQELQLIQANKMSALGLLVSGVAHEINNPNQVVLMNARVLAHAWDDVVDLLDTYAQESEAFVLAGLPYTEMRETLPTLVRGVHDGARRIERIIGDLKDFARPRTRDADPVCQVNDAVQRALRLLAHLIKQRTDHVQVDLAPGLPPVRGDMQQVEQVVVNLLTNALEALPERTRGVIVTTAFEAATRCVTLAVSDEGVGIQPEHLARLCDPFFTTKHESGGTGLGLAITASLVRAQGGQLTFASEPGQGTRVLVTWLCHDPAPPLSPNISPACRETASA
jgi:PAS domain S-box-containing protein